MRGRIRSTRQVTNNPTRTCALLHLHVGFPHYLAPLLRLAAGVSEELLRRAADGLDAIAEQPVADLRHLEHLDHLRLYAVDDGPRRAAGRAHARPRYRLETGQALLGHGRDVLQRGK